MGWIEADFFCWFVGVFDRMEQIEKEYFIWVPGGFDSMVQIKIEFLTLAPALSTSTHQIKKVFLLLFFQKKKCLLKPCLISLLNSSKHQTVAGFDVAVLRRRVGRRRSMAR